MIKKIAQRAKKIAPFQVMAILEQAQELQTKGHDVIHLEVGEPDFATPHTIKQAAINAIEQGRTGYTPALGLPQLRAKIAEHYQKEFQVEISPQRIIITNGASGALQLLMAARVEAGDQVIMASPGYPCNQHFVSTFSGQAKLVATQAVDDFQLTAKQVSEHWQPGKSQAVLLASPANPTGAVLAPAQLKEIYQQVTELNGELWLDEIYQGLLYDQASSTALSIADDIVVLNSFSKYFAMTGWRLGWMVVPEHYVEPINRLAQNLFLAPSTPAQWGAMAAFDEQTLAIVKERVAELKQRRDYLLAELPRLGFKIAAKPSGAFYIYLDVSQLTDNSELFCQALLQQSYVALTPGTDFDQTNGQHYIRLAYAAPLPRLQQAVERIKDFISQYKK